MLFVNRKYGNKTVTKIPKIKPDTRKGIKSLNLLIFVDSTTLKFPAIAVNISQKMKIQTGTGRIKLLFSRLSKVVMWTPTPG